MLTREELRAESDRVEANATRLFQETKKKIESLYAEIRGVLDAFVAYEDNYIKAQEREEHERNLERNPDTKPRK
jgi:hypothetical protein